MQLPDGALVRVAAGRFADRPMKSRNDSGIADSIPGVVVVAAIFGKPQRP